MNQTQKVDKRSILIGVGILAFLCWLIWFLLSFAWGKLSSIDSNLAVGILTASTTVIVAAITVALGKYFERKKEIEAHFRETKVKIYDEFLTEFFNLFNGDDENETEEEDLVNFLREWQRKMVLWGGSDVLSKYIEFKSHLSKSEPNAQTMFLTEDLFKAIRKDLGLSNRGLEKGLFSHLILRNSEFFLQQAKTNPNITLAEVAALEEKLLQKQES